MAHEYILVMAFSSTSVISWMEVLVASTSMDVDAFVDDARGTVALISANDAWGTIAVVVTDDAWGTIAVVFTGDAKGIMAV